MRKYLMMATMVAASALMAAPVLAFGRPAATGSGQSTGVWGSSVTMTLIENGTGRVLGQATVPRTQVMDAAIVKFFNIPANTLKFAISSKISVYFD